MKVILIEELPHIGKIGDIVSVKNGYAKNFLMPKKKAISYSVANYKIFEDLKKKIESQNLEKIELAEKVKSMLQNKKVVIIESSSDDGQLYGSVKSNSIAKELNKLIGEKIIERTHIAIEKPIKEIGIHNIKINIHSDVEIIVPLYISRTQSEAESLIKSLQNKQKSEIKTDAQKEV